MKSLLLGVGLLLSTMCAFAGPAKSSAPAVPWRFDIYPLNFELRYERDATQQLVDRRPLNLALGVRKGPSTVLFEYSRFNETTGNATLSVDRTHEEFLFWWKQNILNFEMLDFFLAGGLGAYDEKVKTTFEGVGETTDSTGMQIMGGGSAGVQSLLWRYVLVSFEGRLMAGKNFDPNPQPSLLLRLGVEF